MKTKRVIMYLPFILLSAAASCQERKNTPAAVAATTGKQPVRAQQRLSGAYNAADDAWETTDSSYSSYNDFSGMEYASFQRLDKEGNSLGMGLINKQGEIVVQPLYSGLTIGFTNGLCEVTDKNDKKGLVNDRGIEIVKPQYDMLWVHKEYFDVDSNVVIVGLNNKQGAIDRNGKVVIPVTYGVLTPAGDGLFMFMKEAASWGFINYKNEVVIPAQFTHTGTFVKGKMTLQNADGEEMTVYSNGKVEKK